ncbi:hypothetical protein [Lysinibacillus sp. fls2-241-R2A-57]|uniref:hypothetical protein n=1 Tax=Lysinibacillus sp. fls2-241-R2A-57 TaxID=3040292 RepID=UPI002554A761|nr:hypothetical protein [Lysinibacillus sp. fls2-241-R2A-57]
MAESFLMQQAKLTTFEQCLETCTVFATLLQINEPLVHLVGIWVEPRVINTCSSLYGARACVFLFFNFFQHLLKEVKASGGCYRIGKEFIVQHKADSGRNYTEA